MGLFCHSFLPCLRSANSKFGGATELHGSGGAMKRVANRRPCQVWHTLNVQRVWRASNLCCIAIATAMIAMAVL